MTRVQPIGEESDECDEKEKEEGDANGGGGMDDEDDAGGAEETEEKLNVSFVNGIEETIDEEERKKEASQAVAACEGRRKETV